MFYKFRHLKNERKKLSTKQVYTLFFLYFSEFVCATTMPDKTNIRKCQKFIFHKIEIDNVRRICIRLKNIFFNFLFLLSLNLCESNFFKNIKKDL